MRSAPDMTNQRLVYFDCASGASGEMLLGALVSAGLLEADLRDVVAPLQRAGASFELRLSEVSKGPVQAIELRITDQVPDVEARVGDMLGLIRSAPLSPGVTHDASAILTRLAAEEARLAGERTADFVFNGTSGIDCVVAAVGTAGAAVHRVGTAVPLEEVDTRRPRTACLCPPRRTAGRPRCHR